MPTPHPEFRSSVSRFERHPRLTLWAILLVCFALLEWLVRVFAGLGILPIERQRLTVQSRFFHESEPDFGRWHFPNVQFHDTGPCYDSVYHNNRHGARDRDREPVSDLSRTAVLGDSFVEGLYVDDGQRITDHLETLRKRPHLNFGTIGFSPIMEWVQYRTLVTKFDHDEVLVFMLPSNDFSDSDPEQREVNGYRPYLRQNPESKALELYYPVPYQPSTQNRDLSRSKIFLNYLSTYWYTYNVVRQGFRALKRGHSEGDSSGPTPPPYQFSDRRFAPQVFHAYDQLALLTGEKPLTLFIIPTELDLQAYGDSTQVAPVVSFIKELEKRHEHLRVIDLLPGFMRYAKTHQLPIKAFFLPCDWHWGALGHRVAAEIVTEYLADTPERDLAAQREQVALEERTRLRKTDIPHTRTKFLVFFN